MNYENLLAIMRRNLCRFVRRWQEKRSPVFDFLLTGGPALSSAYLFGGALRDLLLGPDHRCPRDIDIIIMESSLDRIRTALASYVDGYTRFGGLRLRDQYGLFDIWPLAQTWAFREGLVVPISIESLPRTTFLNVEAVAARLPCLKGRGRRILASREFFRGVAERILEINFEDNPSPASCVVRSLVIASRLSFRIGPRLAMYIAHYGPQYDVGELWSIERSHYGRIFAGPESLNLWIRHILEERRRSAGSAIGLPKLGVRQLVLSAEFEAGAEGIGACKLDSRHLETGGHAKNRREGTIC